MSDPAPSPELLRSLGRLVRGLSALFWGLPLALILGMGTANAGWFRSLICFGFDFGFVPVLTAAGLMLFGLWQLGSFQRQERPWRHALDRARLFALVNVGLSPFLYWWNRQPEQPFFAAAVGVLAFAAMLYLFELNFVLLRLGAMLPDEGLRIETRRYTAINRSLLITLLTLASAYLVFSRVVEEHLAKLAGYPGRLDILSLQITIPSLGLQFSSFWVVWFFLCILVLLPLSITMALIWKTKEVILDSVFAAK